MTVLALSPTDLALAGVLVILLALLSFRVRIGMAGQILIAASRATVQLLLVGLVLKALFAHVNLIWVILIAVFMLLVGAREVRQRQQRRFRGHWGYTIGAAAMLLPAFSLTAISLTVIIGTDPWYEPQYAIPLLGMLLGNTMSGIAIGLDRFTHTVWQQRAIVEAKLTLGATSGEAVQEARRDSARSGFIPIINAMSVAGLVVLPGMMTGQILAGSPPFEAVKYQILIFFLIACSAGFGTIAAVWVASRRLFDERQRLRLDRLRPLPTRKK